jgi:hypothetical protein
MIFELPSTKSLRVADAIGGDSERIFNQRYPPTDEDCGQHGKMREFEVPVPGERHEDVRDD